MTFPQIRSVSLGLASAAIGLALSGCAAPPAPQRPGALELRIDREASYTLVGRFRVSPIEPSSPSRDIDFDTRTSQARVELPAGTFTLALGAGARLVCADEAAEPPATTVPRLVSASQQVISITAGEVTTAHIGFGSLADPCSNPLAMGEPAPWH